MGLSRNKVAVSEGAAGSPPFYGESSQVEIPRDRIRKRNKKQSISQRTEKANTSMSGSKYASIVVRFSGSDDPGKAKEAIRGCSSVGRAPALQAGGQEFESLHLHHGWENQLGRTLNGLIAQQARALA